MRSWRNRTLVQVEASPREEVRVKDNGGSRQTASHRWWIVMLVDVVAVPLFLQNGLSLRVAANSTLIY
ncbi:hypothetical protein GUJ93_ZPchr0001g30425 [Zizania palustris]|uniref:Uncharacterized protein n=1 Tax=Zizania palustris TaxID=103762 RepID=A0A8J5S5E8_ZIZPA|nr:hypothetical protein GUJ93_ZPchr0001g30425 [Zizania palustris]